MCGILLLPLALFSRYEAGRWAENSLPPEVPLKRKKSKQVGQQVILLNTGIFSSIMFFLLLVGGKFMACFDFLEGCHEMNV